MIDINKIKELITNSKEVILTAHKNIDLDALGSILGLYYISKNIGKAVYIIIEDEEFEPEINRAILSLKALDNMIFTTYKDIKDIINNKTLLIITDTNKASRVQNTKLLDIKNKIVIDHHIKSADKIKNTIYEYLEVGESSATEIIMDLITALNIYIPPEVATIMLAGIYVDTNGFILKTNKNTHICASKLCELKANEIEMQYLLKQNFDEYKRRQKIINKTEFINNIAVAKINKIYDNTELAKACDVLLSFDKIEVSFAIAKLDKKTIGISARSIGNVDVSKIMTNFNGGGHKTDAAAQIKNSTIDEVSGKLLDYIRGI